MFGLDLRSGSSFRSGVGLGRRQGLDQNELEDDADDQDDHADDGERLACANLGGRVVLEAGTADFLGEEGEDERDLNDRESKRSGTEADERETESSVGESGDPGASDSEDAGDASDDGGDDGEGGSSLLHIFTLVTSVCVVEALVAVAADGGTGLEVAVGCGSTVDGERGSSCSDKEEHGDEDEDTRGNSSADSRHFGFGVCVWCEIFEGELGLLKFVC